MLCQVDTCGENRNDGKAWEASVWVAQALTPDDIRLKAVCLGHMDGWYEGSDEWLPKVIVPVHESLHL